MFGINRPASAPEAKQDTERPVQEKAAEQSPAKNNNADATQSVLKPSIISEGFHLTGDIESQGGLHIEGTVNGNLRLDNVTIGSQGKIVGTIRCKTLHIKGIFDGEASCEELTLSGKAVVNGKISYRNVVMAQGTALTGTLTRT